MDAGRRFLKAAHLVYVVAVAVVACAAVGATFVIPQLRTLPADELVRTTAWSLATLFAFAGFGGVVARACWPGREVALALRTTWGAGLFVLLGGVLASVSLLSRGLLIGFTAAGVALFAREIVVGRAAIARDLHVRLRATRLYPFVFAVVLFVTAVLVVRYLGGASDIACNPYDDEIAYYPFAKQLLQRGTLLDPFSFRRMSTLGGQAIIHALLLARVGILHLNVFDRAMCILLSAGLLSSMRVDGRKVPVLARALSVLLLVTLPNTGINSASYYSGVAFFLALYQTLALMPDAPADTVRGATLRVLPFALVGAALCTMRQNYQATVGLTVLVTYGLMIMRLRKRVPLRTLVLEPVACLALLGAFVAPWLILSYRSSDTFLFPFMQGTFRADVGVTSHSMTLARFVRFFVKCWLTPEPIHTAPLFFAVGLLARERSARRPLGAQWIAAFVSFAMLCFAFSLSDPGSLARYAYGFVTASVLFTWQSVATTVRPRLAGARDLALVGATTFAFLVPLHESKDAARVLFDVCVRDTAELFRRTIPPQIEPPVAQAYHHMQDAVPPGAPILVMVDQPYLFDYARNPIMNFDTPGSASAKPGMPAFRGSEPVARYLRDQGIRYVAFIDPERSAFLYRRELWEDQVFDPDEIWRQLSPYAADVVDNLVALKKSRRSLVDESSMTLLDLEAAP